MKEFKSNNDILMVEGKLFNWKKESLYHGKEEPFGYMMDFGWMENLYSAVYQPRERELCIYRNSSYLDFIARFFCEDIYIAETIVEAFMKGNRLDIKETIYQKK